jgi:penicillin amidase
MRPVLSLLALLNVLAPVPSQAQDLPLQGLQHRVQVHFDSYDVPHIFAASWPDAARTLGYLHASERLPQMEFYRRIASGTMAEMLGPYHLQDDIKMRQLGLRRTSQEWWDSADMPAEFRADLEAYAAGANARFREYGDSMPPPLSDLGIKVAPWSPVDSIVFMKYMGWDQSGTADDLWFGMMVEKLGIEAAEALWPLDRPYEVPAVKQQADRPAPASKEAMAPIPGASGAYAAAFKSWNNANWLGRGGAFGSNNWAIDGTRTASGKPILCSDPHLGFTLPMTWYMAHINVAGESVVGVTFPIAPNVIIGHNDRIGWGITNMQADSVDYFVETPHASDPHQYLHRNEWKQLRRVQEFIKVRGAADHIEDIDYTVHGPIISREGRTIALQWNGLGITKDGLAVWLLNRGKNLADALHAFDQIMTPPINMAYADVDGNIALHPCGALPVRMRGQGRIPMDGASGNNDWDQMIPRGELPLALNPPNHFIASANNRPHPFGYPHYLGWMWDPSYRARRIDEMLSVATGVTVDSMKAIQTDAHDKAAEMFLPHLLEGLSNVRLGDPWQIECLQVLSGWNYVAHGATAAPLLWQEWFSSYRKAVWDDEWSSRGIEQPQGSWGFTGDNHREPMLEVLEFITREHHTAPWFSNHAAGPKGAPTLQPVRQTRDEVALQAFISSMARLKERAKGDMATLRWDRHNILRIRSLFGQPEAAREGGPVVGTSFTVNPGGEGDGVGGGASFRLIVDFGDTTTSVGAYPGGQSGEPYSTHYADIMQVWARGDYLPLHAYPTPEALLAAATHRSIGFTP